MRKAIVISIAILAMVCFFSFNAHADGWTDGWDVISAGTNADLGVYLVLSDGVTTIVAWPRDDVAGYQNQALAVGLSAQAGTVKVVIGSFTAGGRFGLIQYKV